MSIRVKFFIFLMVTLLAIPAIPAQKKSTKKPVNAVMWERVNIRQRDLFYGPGGKAMMPNLRKITFIKEEKGGHNKKYRIKDGSGKTWVAKLGREAQPETAAVRLLWALGYKTEINYLVPTLTIPTKGTYQNVRLEARPDNIERLDEWQWKDNPFIGSKELQGLKIMMVFFNNWDVLDLQNKVIQNGSQHQYIISDLGATFGKLGNNNLFMIYRLGRKTNNPKKYMNSSFIDEVENGEVDLAYKGKNRDLFENISIEDARWLSNLLSQLSDKQIEDAFRAANYSGENLEMFKQGVKNRIAELKFAARGEKLAKK